MSTPASVPLGATVPPITPHAISVSLPTWKDNVGYEEGEKRVVDAMISGYPRFFIHLSICKLATICEQKFAVAGESCMLFPSQKTADACRLFLIDRSTLTNTPVSVRLVQFLICPDSSAPSEACIELHVVLFPKDAFPIAKQFWQHTGLGISSRLADRCLSLLPDEPQPSPAVATPTRPTKPGNKHYSAKPARAPLSPTHQNGFAPSPDDLDKDHSAYLEERYGRNLPPSSASAAKCAMRRRIAGVLLRDTPQEWLTAGQPETATGPSTRGVREVSEDDVYLYQTGMTAIWSAHQLALGTRPSSKSVCFGFPYTDTLKILEKWGPGCHFLGHGLDSDIDELEKILNTQPPILALFTEFPSNPLLRCADLPRLRKLADKHDFLIIVDDTLGNCVNIDVLPYADVVVSSLSKIFSGDANVMGGSLVLNPKGHHYAELKEHLRLTYEDNYFNEDALFMERNSRDFKQRIKVIDDNTEAICDFLRTQSAIKEVFYPKYTTPDHYNRCRVSDSMTDAGYGGLFSVTFHSPEAARAFFDNLPFYKGPSLGTNFTLACPYTVLAHFTEFDWAAKYDVEASLVRVSIGMEDRTVLLEGFGKAVKAATECSIR